MVPSDADDGGDGGDGGGGGDGGAQSPQVQGGTQSAGASVFVSPTSSMHGHPSWQ